MSSKAAKGMGIIRRAIHLTQVVVVPPEREEPVPAAEFPLLRVGRGPLLGFAPPHEQRLAAGAVHRAGKEGRGRRGPGGWGAGGREAEDGGVGSGELVG